MTKTFSVALLAVLLCSTLCADDEGVDAPPNAEFFKTAFSKKTIDIISGATRVESFRIEVPRRRKDPAPATSPSESIRGYPIIFHGKELDNLYAKRMAEVIFDRQTYADYVAGCFEPGIAFRFWKERESAEVLICFHCGNLSVSSGEDHASFSFHRERGQPRLVKLAKDAFPDDQAIQKLKE